MKAKPVHACACGWLNRWLRRYVDHTAAFIMAAVSTPVIYFGLQFTARVRIGRRDGGGWVMGR